MSATEAPLPILARRAEIELAVRHHQVVVVCGETGSGKTTQLPQICLDMVEAGVLGAQAAALQIGHTQPRRLAARAVAARIAEERGETVGGLVGVKVRFHDQTSPRTRIKVLTDGMLLAELAGDPELKRYGVVIIDEAHERSINIDFLLGYFRQLLPRRPELRLIITSATIEPGRFSAFFGGSARAPVIEVSGRTYPIEFRHRQDKSDLDQDDISFEAVADAAEDLIGPGRTGDVLVFLPGEREIRLASDAIARRRTGAELLPLFSRLGDRDQDRIFHPSASGPQRVILATNVAETSLTVPGIRYVIDTGLARISRYDASKKIQRLPIEPVSQASARQRAGRCGRTGPGICVRLFSEGSLASRPVFTDPEIKRTSLASVILQMRALELGDIEEFPFLDPPPPEAIRDGYETLFELGAIGSPDRSGTLTPLGRRLSRIPLDPRIARMLLGGESEGALEEAITLAAVLSLQDPRERPTSRQEEADRAHLVFRDESSDFLTLLNVWSQYEHAAAGRSTGEESLAAWCRRNFLSPGRMREWAELARQIRQVASELGLKSNVNRATSEALHRALLTGLISNVACREGDGSFDYRGVRGNVVQIFPGSALFKKGPRWIMAAELVQTTRLYARTVARIEPEWIEELAGHMFRRQLSDHHLDAESGRPSAWERVTMSGIVVVPRRRTSLEGSDTKAGRELFIREALARCRWTTDAPFMAQNRALLERARSAEARLRRRDVRVPERAIIDWFESRIPPDIDGPGSFEPWRASAERGDARVHFLSPDQVLTEQGLSSLDPERFPDAIRLSAPINGQGLECPLEYSLSPGQDDDGLTLTVPLSALPTINAYQLEWLVPGLLNDLVLSLIKTLPKALRQKIEARGRLDDVACSCAAALQFGSGSLAAALAEALGVLHGIDVEPTEFAFKSIPPHFRMRIRVVDQTGKELGADRDLAVLLKRCEGRIQRQAELDRKHGFHRSGLTTWDFDDLLDSKVPTAPQSDSTACTEYPAIVDDGDSVSLTLAASADLAAACTRLGVRRLFVLACLEELGYSLDALPERAELAKCFGTLGTTQELRDQLACIICERVFMENQRTPRSQAEFEQRLDAGRGRLPAVARECGELVLSILEPRSRVAHRISGGTPRLWAESIADIREHAVYLMPRGFLGLVPPERLRRYPAYAALMSARIQALREDGSKREEQALRIFAPHWKRFTGWVAAAMSASQVELADDAPGVASAAGRVRSKKAPLPQARRAAASVNLDAGEWALRAGALPARVDAYRWSLEELRLAVFDNCRSESATALLAETERLWKLVTPPGKSPART